MQIEACKVVAGMRLADKDYCNLVTQNRYVKKGFVEIYCKGDETEPPRSSLWTVKADQLVNVKA